MSNPRAFRPPAELVSAIRGGEPQAEEELVVRYRRGVTIILRQYLGQGAEAEDLFQETFRLTLVKVRGGEVREPERLAGFVSALARNLAIQSMRRDQRRQTEPGLEPEVSAGAGTSGHPLARRMPESQLERLLRGEAAELVRQVIGDLRTERDRQLLLRYYLAEEDSATIRADLALSRDHFYRVLHRAKQRYRKLYEKAVGAGQDSAHRATSEARGRM